MKVQAGCGKEPKGGQVWDRNRRTDNCGPSVTQPCSHPASMDCLVSTASFVTDYCTQQAVQNIAERQGHEDSPEPKTLQAGTL